MSPVGAQSDAATDGSGGSDGAVNFGDVDVTFSSPFYTGVFLSSRELQGNYSEHQKIVTKEMQGTLAKVWKYPRPGCESWKDTVSPVYFIGAELDSLSAVQSQEIENAISNFEDNYKFNFVKIEIKFFEFGFGVASIRFKKPKSEQNTVSSSRDLKKILLDCEKTAKLVLDFIASEVTKIYRSSVPCCVKNSDIWDVDNFAALESSEGSYKIGEVKGISTVAVIEQKCQAAFLRSKRHINEKFLYFSENLHKTPVNAAYQLFTDGENITIALGSPKNNNKRNEIEQLFFANEMILASLAIEKYFKNFFYSYYNYISTENELFESEDNIRWWNIWKLKNAIEKFSDIQLMYFQTKDFVSNNMLTSNHSLYIAELYTIHPKLNSKKSIFSATDVNIMQMQKLCDQIKFTTAQYWQISTSTLTVNSNILIVSFSIFITLLLGNLNLFGAIIIFIAILISLFTVVMFVTSFRLRSRKLYYFCELQKKEYRRMFKDQNRKNQNRKACVCKVKDCHRCLGWNWHPRVFYFKENLCSRCGIAHEVRKKDKTTLVEIDVCHRYQGDEWYSLRAFGGENLFFDVKNSLKIKGKLYKIENIIFPVPCNSLKIICNKNDIEIQISDCFKICYT